MTDQQRRVFVVQFTLFAAAVGWTITLWFLFQPWNVVAAGLLVMGGPAIPYHPFLDYWQRIIAGAFGLIGIFFLIVALQFEKFRPVVLWIGLFHLALGIISTVSSVMNKMSPDFHPTLVAEITFLWVVGLVLCALCPARTLNNFHHSPAPLVGFENDSRRLTNDREKFLS